MPPTTTKRFRWVDRDTAARDLMQVAYHAPLNISRQALHLIKAIRSPVILPELEAIVFDEGRDERERSLALDAISTIQDDLYMPHFKKLLVYGDFNDFFPYLNSSLFRFAIHNPSNLSWLFDSIGELEPSLHRDTLCEIMHYALKDEVCAIIGDQLIQLFEQLPALLNIKSVETLYFDDKRQSTIEWLATRWETLIYLCLCADTREIISLLENWRELKILVFTSCPIIILEYDPRKADRHEIRPKRREYVNSPIWQKLTGLHELAAKENGRVQNALLRAAQGRNKPVPSRAAAVHFLVKLENAPARSRMLKRLIETYDDWGNEYHPSFYAPIRFEAGDTLKNSVSPEIWQTLVNAFFVRPNNTLQPFLIDWIAYQTDVLSGIEGEYKGMNWRVEDRPWFHALADLPDDLPELEGSGDLEKRT